MIWRALALTACSWPRTSMLKELADMSREIEELYARTLNRILDIFHIYTEADCMPAPPEMVDKLAELKDRALKLWLEAVVVRVPVSLEVAGVTITSIELKASSSATQVRLIGDDSKSLATYVFSGLCETSISYTPDSALSWQFVTYCRELVSKIKEGMEKLINNLRELEEEIRAMRDEAVRVAAPILVLRELAS